MIRLNSIATVLEPRTFVARPWNDLEAAVLAVATFCICWADISLLSLSISLADAETLDRCLVSSGLRWDRCELYWLLLTAPSLTSRASWAMAFSNRKADREDDWNIPSARFRLFSSWDMPDWKFFMSASMRTLKRSSMI